MTVSKPLNRPLRVAYVLKRYPRFSETFIVNEILALEKLGVDLRIFAFKPATEGCFHENLSQVRAKVTYLGTTTQKVSSYHAALVEAGQKLPSISTQLSTLFAEDSECVEFAIRIALELQQQPVDVIHAHFASKSATVARVASALTAIPYSFTAHAKDIFHEDVSFDDLRAKFRDAARIITVSDFNRRYLQQHFPEAQDRIVRIYNGMDLSRLQFSQALPVTPRIIAVGRLVPKKGFADLLQAIVRLIPRFPDLHCDLVGDGPLRESLEDQCADLGIKPHVTFHGLQAQHRVHQLITEAALFVAPCVVSEDGDRDGLPTVLLEAMALGTPVLATAVTGIPELIENGRNGLVTAQRDPAALAVACARVLTDPPFGEALRHAARSTIENTFNIDHTASLLSSQWQPLSAPGFSALEASA